MPGFRGNTGGTRELCGGPKDFFEETYPEEDLLFGLRGGELPLFELRSIRIKK